MKQNIYLRTLQRTHSIIKERPKEFMLVVLFHILFIAALGGLIVSTMLTVWEPIEQVVDYSASLDVNESATPADLKAFLTEHPAPRVDIDSQFYDVLWSFFISFLLIVLLLGAPLWYFSARMGTSHVIKPHKYYLNYIVYAVGFVFSLLLLVFLETKGPLGLTRLQGGLNPLFLILCLILVYSVNVIFSLAYMPFAEVWKTFRVIIIKKAHILLSAVIVILAVLLGVAALLAGTIELSFLLMLALILLLALCASFFRIYFVRLVEETVIT